MLIPCIYIYIYILFTSVSEVYSRMTFWCSQLGCIRDLIFPKRSIPPLRSTDACSVGIDVSPAAEAVTGVTWAVYLHPLSRLRMNGSIILTFLRTFMKLTGTNLLVHTFYLNFHLSSL